MVISCSHNKKLTYYVKWICEFYYLVLTKLSPNVQMSSKEISTEKMLLKDSSNIANTSEQQETGRAEPHFTFKYFEVKAVMG